MAPPYAAGFIPVCSLGLSQAGRLNLGQEVSSLRYFTICGLQEGFEPFAINMKRDIAMWFSKSLPHFSPVPAEHPHYEVRGARGCLSPLAPSGPCSEGWRAPAVLPPAQEAGLGVGGTERGSRRDEGSLALGVLWKGGSPSCKASGAGGPTPGVEGNAWLGGIGAPLRAQIEG